MIGKIYKTTFWIFTIESLLILIGVNLNFIDYGVDFQTTFMLFGIILGLVSAVMFYFLIRKFNSRPKEILGILFSVVMFVLCLYYVLEDHFVLSI